MADFFLRKTERTSELLVHGVITVTYVPISLFSLVRENDNSLRGLPIREGMELTGG